MAGPKVRFKLTVKDKFTCPDVEYSTSTANLFKPQYATGQIIFVEDAGQIFLDFHNWRRCYTATSGDTSGSMKYLGISSTNPDNGTVTIDGIVIEPKANDMVAYGSKEYIYRKGIDGEFKWYEIGDEDELDWNEEV